MKDYFEGKVPENIHLIEANDTTNTYSLINIAAFGLTYTTTVGMELAMSGVPVVVVGETHYRNKGFTMNPTCWDDYNAMLDGFQNVKKPVEMTQEQIDGAWHYAYGFFYEYPYVFPWHMVHFKKDIVERPIGDVLTAEGMAKYRDTFEFIIFNR